MKPCWGSVFASGQRQPGSICTTPGGSGLESQAKRSESKLDSPAAKSQQQLLVLWPEAVFSQGSERKQIRAQRT
jgi:hypothetical protein